MLVFDSIEMDWLEIPFNKPFLTANGLLKIRKVLVLKGISNSATVWSECAAFEDDFYFGYSQQDCFHIFKAIIPKLNHIQFSHPKEAFLSISKLTNNSCCQAALDTLYWQLYAKQNNQNLVVAIGGKRKPQKIVIPLGLNTEYKDLLAYHKKGYDAFKIKINTDTLKLWSQIQTSLPIQIILDANGSLNPDSIENIKALNPVIFKGIEQPFLAEESSLYRQLSDSDIEVYLDESITDLNSAYRLRQQYPHCALTLKPARVGGITPCLDLLKKAPNSRVGGMFETSLGRKVLYVLSTLSPALSDGGPIDLYLDTQDKEVQFAENGYFYP